MRCSVVFGVTSRLLVTNISSSPAINTAAYYQRCVTTRGTVVVVHQGPCLQHLPVAALTAARYRLRITISAYPTCIRPPIWYGKTRMVWLPDGEKISKISLFIFDRMYERDRQTDAHTDGRTPHDGIGRAYA